ncbi:hypothetical protein [Nocardiopsis metallicus]|uniref:Uncharacterized protein n=1 Tax=Nocardiopsis metallicus TaxID=179819 RepID=A0A840WPB6_9ACTN|nr:hypothetical protein [Nocardiopsis metallicus]MBB5494851.1 hypothetical protein [Nocardiopsis metallicus]
MLPSPDAMVSGNAYWLLATVRPFEGRWGRRITTERLNAYKAAMTDS